MSPNTSQWGSRLTRYRPKASAHCIPSASPQNASAIPARLVFTRIGTPIHATGLSARLASRRPNRCLPPPPLVLPQNRHADPRDRTEREAREPQAQPLPPRERPQRQPRGGNLAQRIGRKREQQQKA